MVDTALLTERPMLPGNRLSATIVLTRRRKLREDVIGQVVGRLHEPIDLLVRDGRAVVSPAIRPIRRLAGGRASSRSCRSCSRLISGDRNPNPINEPVCVHTSTAELIRHRSIHAQSPVSAAAWVVTDATATAHGRTRKRRRSTKAFGTRLPASSRSIVSAGRLELPWTVDHTAELPEGLTLSLPPSLSLLTGLLGISQFGNVILLPDRERVPILCDRGILHHNIRRWCSVLRSAAAVNLTNSLQVMARQ